MLCGRYYHLVERRAILRQTELFRDLDDEVLITLASRIVEKNLDRNEILFVAGSEARGLYVVAEGAIRAFRASADGREQVIHVERAVTTIAEVPVFDGGTYPSTAAAEEPTKLFFIARDDIRAVSTKHPELALAAARVLAGRLRKCAELVESLSLREVGQRVALLFLQEAATRGTQKGESVKFVLPLTHNQLAARIGTVREVVTRAIHRLETQNLIRVKGKAVEIADVAALRRYVGAESQSS